MAREAVGRNLSMPIHLAFSYDEEIGCIGVRRLLDMLAELPVRPRFCLVGEPTLMQVATAHKGKASWRVVAHGLEAHSSRAPLSVNAILLAIDLIRRIRAMQDEVAASGESDADYDVPYTTLHVGRFAGGETMNIVPNRASFDFEIRHLPRDDLGSMFGRIEAAAREIVEEAKARFAGARLVFEPLVSYPALDTAPDQEVVAFVKSLTGANATTKISFGTEGGLYQQRLGVPSVVCGPGSIAVAHKPDEYIETAQLDACGAFLSRLVDRLSR
jgi:acetylornithine deacetylase